MTLGAVSHVSFTTFDIAISSGAPVSTNVSVSLTYTAGGLGDSRLRLKANPVVSRPEDKFEMVTSTFPLSDGARPVLVSAVALVNTANVILTFSEPLSTVPALSVSDVGVSFNPAASVTGISRSGSQVTVTLNRAFLLADYATANISSCGSNIQDLSSKSAFHIFDRVPTDISE